MDERYTIQVRRLTELVDDVLNRHAQVRELAVLNRAALAENIQAALRPIADRLRLIEERLETALQSEPPAGLPDPLPRQPRALQYAVCLCGNPFTRRSSLRQKCDECRGRKPPALEQAS